MAAAVPPPEARSLAVFDDGVSSLSYLSSSTSNDSPLLASTSWDGSVRIHGTVDGQLQLVHAMESGPLLSLATTRTTEASLVTGGLDGSVRLLDIASTTPRVLGHHGAQGATASSKDGVSCLSSLDNNNDLVVSAAWSKTLKVWDVRQPDAVVATVDLPGKAFAMDVDSNHHRIVVATSGRKLCFVDWRGGKAELVLERESSLKFQTRCVKFFPQGHGFAVGSVEGRVGVEFLEELLGVTSSNMKKYAFKCHRVNDMVYPVNCIEFSPKFPNVFATGGCDGGVVLWDGENKKKLTTLPTFATSISAMAFSEDGSELAIASSYTFEESDREHPQDEVFVRKVLDSDCLPKPK